MADIKIQALLSEKYILTLSKRHIFM